VSAVADTGVAVSSGANAETLTADAKRERRTLISLCSPSILLVAVIILLPIGWLSWLSFYDAAGQLTLENYGRMLESKAYIKTFKTTFKISFVVTGVCILIGYPLAYLISQLGQRMANICMIFVIIPFWTSLLVRTYAWLVLLQRKGLINGWLIDLGFIEEPLRLVHNFTGTVIGMVHILLPFLVLPLYAAMKSIDRDYIRAAANLGASPMKAFWQVFFPLSLPGLFAGVVLVFVLCLGFYVTPALLGGGKVQMWAMRIESSVNLYANWGAASALGVVLLVVTLLLLWGLNKIFGLERLYSGR
jgi:putative spermidine/putrescine transport system permease protein/spermidine/putrescine transport system permease protein